MTDSNTPTQPKSAKKAKPSKSPRVKDLAEDDLEIFEDTTDCAGLSDSEAEEEYEGQDEQVDPVDNIDQIPRMSDTVEMSDLGVSQVSQSKDHDLDNNGSKLEENHTAPTESAMAQGLSENDLEVGTSDFGQTITDGDLVSDAETTVNIDVAITRTNEEGERDMVTSRSDLGVDASGLRAKANTPVSMFNDELHPSEIKLLEERHASCLAAESREAMFQQAMNLMSERCTSTVDPARNTNKTPLVCVKNLPYGPQIPKYFYVHQKKPAPMEPLKAWRGYHGNVYFEPITVNKANYVNSKSQRAPVDVKQCSPKLQQVLGKSRSLTSMDSQRDTPQRQSRNAIVSRNSNNHSSMSRQMAILDKKAVLRNENDNIHEDLTWIVGQESTGSLCIQASPLSRPDPKTVYSKEKICRGSVAHKLHMQRNNRFPMLSVMGDRFTRPTAPSPLLRTQTQYSHSSARIGINSPDLYHGFTGYTNYERLPPLEQLRASLRHMDHGANQDPLVHMIPPLERMKFEDPLNMTSKPFVKYSPEIRQSSASAKKTPVS